MMLYHGSDVEVQSPNLSHSRLRLDFGRGFYVTPLYEQAEKWALRFKLQGKNAVISCYSFEETALTELKVLSFDSYSEDWLDFIIDCRRGLDKSTYDIVMGGIANDQVFNTLELYFDQLIDKNEAIKRLQYEKPSFQICLRSEVAIHNYLRFERSILL